MTWTIKYLSGIVKESEVPNMRSKEEIIEALLETMYGHDNTIYSNAKTYAEKYMILMSSVAGFSPDTPIGTADEIVVKLLK